MNVLICIKTYDRLPYLKQLFESLEKTITHDVDIVVHDDGSSDGSVKYLKKKDITLLESDNIGTTSATNYLLMYARKQDYDIGFMIEDDLFFKKKGWIDLYYNAIKQSGYPHLVHHNQNWEYKDINISNGPLTSFGSADESQGAFWTFNRQMIEELGYFDHKLFGRRALAHWDYTMRACRCGYNEEDTLWDAKGANKYIQLHGHENYIRTPEYDKEIERARNFIEGKEGIIHDSSRKYIDIYPSPVNFFFDHVYCLNLKKRTDRRHRAKQVLDELNIDFTFFNAINGKQDIRAINLYRKTENIGYEELGCYLSHKAIYKDAIDNEYSTICVFEDDIIPHNNANDILLNYFDVPEWKMLYLGASDWYWDDHKQNWNGETYYRGEKINATHAYAIKLDTIRKAYLKFSQRPNKPADTRLHEINKEHPSYILKPNAFIQDIRESDIRDGRPFKDWSERFDWNLKNYQICD